MTSHLAGQLTVERHRQFVGRAEERELFQNAISSDTLPFNVLYVFGPSGVGKTTLLREFAYVCEKAGVPAGYVDARNVEPSPGPFISVLGKAMGLAPDEDGFSDKLAERTGIQVALVDTYESLFGLDAWLRDTFLPELPDSLLLVLAGCDPPPDDWRTDPGWQCLIHPLPLRNLGVDESREYLGRSRIPAERHESILSFTHGHPLALSLVADAFMQRPDLDFKPEATPDIIRTLLGHFVRQVPSPAHCAALKSCALVPHTNETLLSRMLATPDANELFEWLRTLTFVESEPIGLFPHDAAREVLAADLHWRNPDWYAELHGRARSYYKDRLRHTCGQEQQRVLFDYMFLHRDNPVIRPFLEWQETGPALPEAMREDDKPYLAEIVAHHEGPESARLAAYWLERQPANVVTYRDHDGKPGGFLVKVALHETTEEDREEDPGIRSGWSYLENCTPLRPGEKSTHFRFWMARDTYQDVSAMQRLLFANIAQHYLSTPRLAFTFFPVADADFWTQAFAYFELTRLEAADYEINGRRYGTSAHDWRVMPLMAWLELLAERETSPEPLAESSMKSPPMAVLGEEEFASAARDALKDLHRSGALGGKPLLRSRLVLDLPSQCR